MSDAIALSGAALDAVRKFKAIDPVTDHYRHRRALEAINSPLRDADVYDVREVIPLLRAVHRMGSETLREPLPYWVEKVWEQFAALAPHWRKLGEGGDDE